jgi:hypothetical protein
MRAAGLRGSNAAGISSSVIFKIASDLIKAPSLVINTIELISSGFLPLASNNAFPTLDCNAENRKFPFGSQSKAKFTAELHILQTPSNKMTGRLSVAKTREDTIFGSSNNEDDNDETSGICLLFFVSSVGVDTGVVNSKLWLLAEDVIEI